MSPGKKAFFLDVLVWTVWLPWRWSPRFPACIFASGWRRCIIDLSQEDQYRQCGRPTGPGMAGMRWVNTNDDQWWYHENQDLKNWGWTMMIIYLNTCLSCCEKHHASSASSRAMIGHVWKVVLPVMKRWVVLYNIQRPCIQTDPPRVRAIPCPQRTATDGGWESHAVCFC